MRVACTTFACLLLVLTSACGSVSATPDGGDGADADPSQPDGGTDAAIVGCTSEAQCQATPATPHCDTDAMRCVECVVLDHCAGNVPICGDDNTCRACVTNAECPSLVCGDSGACVDASRVVYASPSGNPDDSLCGGIELPCSDMAVAVSKWSDARPNLVIVGGTWNHSFSANFGRRVVGIDGASIRIVGNQTTPIFSSSGSLTIDGLVIGGLTAPEASAALVVYGNGGNGELILRDVVIEGNVNSAISVNGSARLITERTVIYNNGQGIRTETGDLTLRRTMIANHPDDGLMGSPTNLVIENSMFLYNNIGNDGFAYGSAIRINSGAGMTGHILFSTFVGNHTNYKGIIECGGAAIPIENNVFFQNSSKGADLLVSCPGLRQGNLADVVIGNGNINSADPLFTDLANGDFSLRSGSPAGNAATTHPEITEDYFGNQRPLGGASDLGAIESF